MGGGGASETRWREIFISVTGVALSRQYSILDNVSGRRGGRKVKNTSMSEGGQQKFQKFIALLCDTRVEFVSFESRCSKLKQLTIDGKFVVVTNHASYSF